MEASFHVRSATFDDLDAILRLWQAMMREHEAGDSRIQLAGGAVAAYQSYVGYHLANSDSLVLAAESTADDRRVIGFTLGTVTRNLPMFLPPRYGYLSDIAVDAAWRRHGVGRALVERLTRWLNGRDAQAIQLQYYQFNAAGAAFWEAMGFKPYYTRMWKAI